MTDQQYVIELEGDQRAIVDGNDAAWLRESLKKEPGATRVRVRFDDLDTEGHGAASSRLRVIVESDDDTEGHAMSFHFPSVQDADAFRKRLLLTGVLAGTVALGAAGGVGLANLTSGDAATGAVAGVAAGTTTGSAWTQDERQIEQAAVATSTGSAWTQDERQAAEGAAVDQGSTTQDAANQGGIRQGRQPR